MSNTSNPFAAAPNGSADIISADTAAQNKKLEEEIEKLILEFYPVVVKAASLNLGGLMFLVNALGERLPDIHPLECARALYVRLVGSAHPEAASQAFTMGSLVASALRK